MEELNNFMRVGGEDPDVFESMLNKITAPVRTGVSALALGLGIGTTALQSALVY